MSTELLPVGIRLNPVVEVCTDRFSIRRLAGQVFALSARALLLLGACGAMVLTGCNGDTAEDGQTAALSQRAAPADFNGDKISDWFIYRGGTWLYFGPSTGPGALSTAKTGEPDPSCVPTPADYDGDGKVDLSQKCGGAWHLYKPDGTLLKSVWTGGVPGDLPAPADHDGDGKADIVVFRAGVWMFYDTASGAYTRSVKTGPDAGGIPVPMDYDGDGNADLSVYQKGAWRFFNDDGTPSKAVWTGGVAGDVPVPGDYHGVGREEVVIFRGGAWQFYNLDTQAYTGGVWTGASISPDRPLQPAPLDLDGDGTLEFTVYNGNIWSFYKDDGTFLRGVQISGVPDDRAISRSQLP